MRVLWLFCLVLSCCYCCLGGVVDYSGASYLSGTNGTRLFSWYFAPVNATMFPTPLIVWLNGGPFCSSLMGLLYENGPFTIDPTSLQPVSTASTSWNHRYHVLYVDSPANTGLSYGPIVSDEITMTRDLVAALKHFFAARPALQKSPLFVAGESYAGKYGAYVGPAFVEAGFNVGGVLMGNAWVDPVNQIGPILSPYLWTSGLVDRAQRSSLTHLTQVTLQLMAQGNFSAANDAWGAANDAALNDGGWYNPADIRQFGFPDFSAGEKWLQLPSTKQQLKVPSFVAPFQMCNDTASDAFSNRIMQSAASGYVELLDKLGVRVLFFTGNMDATVPVISTESWLDLLPWNGASSFMSSNRTVWRFDPNDPFAVAGYVRASPDNRLSEVTVVNAGHMVCMDQKARAREMLEIFVSNATFPVGTSFPPQLMRQMKKRRIRF